MSLELRCMSLAIWYCDTRLVLYVTEVMVYVIVVAYVIYGMVIVKRHWCYMSLASLYMSMLWHMSFTVWYRETPLVLCHWCHGICHCCGICHLCYGIVKRHWCYMSLASWYMSMLWHMSLASRYMSLLWHMSYVTVLWNAIGVICHWRHGICHCCGIHHWRYGVCQFCGISNLCYVTSASVIVQHN
jgi:hypothetical protein